MKPAKGLLREHQHNGPSPRAPMGPKPRRRQGTVDGIDTIDVVTLFFHYNGALRVCVGLPTTYARELLPLPTPSRSTSFIVLESKYVDFTMRPTKAALVMFFGYLKKDSPS